MKKCDKPGIRDVLPSAIFVPSETGFGVAMTKAKLLWSAGELGNTCTSDGESH